MNEAILITGASGGIGRALAKELDQRGYLLLLSGRNQEKLDRLLSELSDAPHQLTVADLTLKTPVDITTPDEGFRVQDAL